MPRPRKADPSALDSPAPRPDIDAAALRDKVAVPDPAAAPADADGEAAGAPGTASVAEARARQDRAQGRIAEAAVPRLDPDRAVSMQDRASEAPRRVDAQTWLWVATVAVLAAAAIAAAASLLA